MADETVASWTDLLRQFRGPLVEALRWSTPALSEIKRNHNPRRWQGTQVVIPVITAPLQGTGALASEVAVLNEPSVIATEQATIESAILATPISFSTKLMHASRAGDESWAEAVPTKMRMAEDAFSRSLNEQILGNGDALLASITGSSSDTTLPVGSTSNWHQLYPGRKVQVVVRSTGQIKATVTITDINLTDTVTVDQSVSVTSSDGLYMEGSWGNTMQGIQQAVATTGTFQGINKANVWAWRGIDCSPAAAADLSIPIMDAAIRKTRRLSGSPPDFWLGDGAVIDKFVHNMTLQARWNGESASLKSGWEGVKHKNTVLMFDDDAKTGELYGISNEDWCLYALDNGPDWDEFTGSMFQRFGSRALPLECWLVWMVQVGYHRCNAFAKMGLLNPAEG